MALIPMIKCDPHHTPFACCIRVGIPIRSPFVTNAFHKCFDTMSELLDVHMARQDHVCCRLTVPDNAAVVFVPWLNARSQQLRMRESHLQLHDPTLFLVPSDVE